MTQVSAKTLDQFYENQLKLIPVKMIHNKPIPQLNDWVNAEVSQSEIYRYRGAIGWAINPGYLVIDIDHKNGTKEGHRQYVKLEERIGVELTPTVSTPTGGSHIYLRLPESYHNKKISKTLKGYEDIDFLSHGKFCVIPGSIKDGNVYDWSDTSGIYWQEAPESLLELIAYDESPIEDLGDFEGLIGSANQTREEVERDLSYLDPDTSYHDWIKIGMGIYDWDPIEGLELWDNWSAAGTTYKKGECEKHWKSFGGSKKRVSYGSIVFMRDEAIKYKSRKVLDNYKKEIAKATDVVAIDNDIARRIKKDIISGVIRKSDTEGIAQAIKARYKEIEGFAESITKFRDMVAVEAAPVDVTTQPQKPQWCEDWVMVMDTGEYYNMQTKRRCSSAVFNQIETRNVPGDDASKPSAVKYTSAFGFIDTVDGFIYMPPIPPSVAQPIVEKESRRYVNTFNPNSIPYAEPITPQGQETIDAVIQHIELVTGKKTYAKTLLQWLAYQVQQPGIKKEVLWAPLLIGPPGAGKSFFGTLLRQALGDENVGTVSSSEVTSNFNSWATGKCVNILEELRLVTHNRYDAYNALKPLVTDARIMINEKGVKQYEVTNTTSYICFSNYNDCLPLDESDRRWWIINIPRDILEKLPNGVSDKDYFGPLYDNVRKHGGQIRQWLLDYPISKKFLESPKAPETVHKLAMVTTEEDNTEGLEELRDFIKKGGNYYNARCISSSHLFTAFANENPDMADITHSSHKKSRLLKRLNYMKLGNRSINGTTMTIWTPSGVPMDTDEIRSQLTKHKEK